MDFGGSWRKWPGGSGDGENRESFENICCEEKVVGRDVRSRKCFLFFFKMRKICTFLSNDDKGANRQGGFGPKTQGPWRGRGRRSRGRCCLGLETGRRRQGGEEGGERCGGRREAGRRDGSFRMI